MLNYEDGNQQCQFVWYDIWLKYWQYFIKPFLAREWLCDGTKGRGKYWGGKNEET